LRWESAAYGTGTDLEALRWSEEIIEFVKNEIDDSRIFRSYAAPPSRGILIGLEVPYD